MFEFMLEPLVQLGKSIFGNRGNFDTMFNLGTGLESQIYNRGLQQQLFNRDDTAVQRAMKDYDAAGLNPLLGLPNAASNTKGFESSGLTVDTLGKKQQSIQVDNLKKEGEYLDAQKKELDTRNVENSRLNKAREAKNKYMAKLLGLNAADYPNGIEFNDYDIKDILLLRGLDKGEDWLKKQLDPNPSASDDDFNKYRESTYNYSNKSQKEQERIDNTIKKGIDGLNSVMKKYDNKGILYVQPEKGSAKSFTIEYNKYGVTVYGSNGSEHFYNDKQFYAWLSKNGYSAIRN